MASCFVIQPFDSGKYDKRFRDIYKPAVEAAGLEAYRVDQDLGVQVPIDAIEKGIRQASVCLADISEDNPNVWYELGYAFASNRPVIMVCSQSRSGKYPFDIQHRSVIGYHADSPSDFDALKASLTAKIAATVKQGETLSQIADATPLTPAAGLSQIELLVLALLAGEKDGMSAWSAKKDAERAGVTPVGFNIGVRKLRAKWLIDEMDMWDDSNGEKFLGLLVSDKGWDWIEANAELFVLNGPPPDDPIPF